MRTRLVCAVLATIAGAACTDTDSATDLNPEGPPMIRQVRLTERYRDAAMVERTRKVFAFGTHELAFPDEVHAVDSAVAVGNGLRVVIDELLVGNYLEEIGCRGQVDSDDHSDYGRVPIGADPDDVARCSVSNDALASTCPGADRESVCICRRPAGCIRGSEVVPEGQPVGVLDMNLDGSADKNRFIPGAVEIKCGDISVPLNFADDTRPLTYWNPSGDQNKPAMGGFDVLGPAIVLAPAGPMPTNIECGLVFAEDVVDKQGERVCAPPNGDIAAGCTPGDTSAFRFRVEPLAFRFSNPADGAMNVPRGTGALTYGVTAPVAPATLAGIQITPAPPVTPTITAMMEAIVITLGGSSMPLDPQTQYTVTFPTTLTDTFGQALPQPRMFRFTTGN